MDEEIDSAVRSIEEIEIQNSTNNIDITAEEVIDMENINIQSTESDPDYVPETESRKKSTEQLSICPVCKCSISSKSLARHLRNQHNTTKKSINSETTDFKCETCEKSYSNAKALKRHIRLVHEGKDHKCEYCGKTFSQAEHLKNHIHAVHEGQIDFKCEQCNRYFSRRTGLKRHNQTVHEKQKEFKCHFCRKSFTQEGVLKRHIRTVHEGLNFTCELCNKSFSRNDILKRHLYSVHEGQKE